jgi:hypothetical protein
MSKQTLLEKTEKEAGAKSVYIDAGLSLTVEGGNVGNGWWGGWKWSSGAQTMRPDTGGSSLAQSPPTLRAHLRSTFLPSQPVTNLTCMAPNRREQFHHGLLLRSAKSLAVCRTDSQVGVIAAP